MKNFYSFLKGLMAAMLLCLGVLTPNAANAANGIQGVQGVSAYTADDLVGLWTAAYDWSSEGTKYNPSAAPMSLEFVKEGDALKLKGFGESEVVLNVTVTATGIQLEPMMTIGAGGNYIFGTDDNGDTAVTFTQEADGSLKMSSEEGYFECPSDDFWFKNIVMTKVSGGASGGSFDHAPAELAGYYVFDTNDWVAVSADPDYPVDATTFPTHFYAQLTVGEDGKVYMKNFVGTPGIRYRDVESMNWAYAESSYVGTWNEADQTITFEWPAAHESGSDYTFYVAYDLNVTPWKLSAPLVLQYSTSSWTTSKYLAAKSVKFESSYGDAISTERVSGRSFESAGLALADLEGHWKLNGKVMGENDDLVDGSIEFDVVKKDDGSVVMTNVNGNDHEFPMIESGLGFNVEQVMEYGETTMLGLTGNYRVGGNVEFVVNSKKRLTLNSKDLFFEDANSAIWMFYGATAEKVYVEPAFDPAPAALAGVYTMTVASYESDNVDTSDVPNTFKGNIKVDERGRVLMTGLIGTPTYSAPGDYGYVEVDTCYVGYYNEAAKTVTFYYPENDEENHITYDMWVDYEAWECGAPFTMNVNVDDEGIYTLTATEDVQFLVGMWNPETCLAKGVTFVKRKEYTMDKSDLIGKWNFNFQYFNESNQYEDIEVPFYFYEREDGSLYMKGIPGDDNEISVKFDGKTLTIPAFMEIVDEDGDDTTEEDSYYYILTANQDDLVDITFSVGENKTLIFDNEIIMFVNKNVADGDALFAPGKGVHAPVELSPAPGHYATMPNEFVLRTNKYDIASVDAVGYRTQGSFRTTMLDESAYVVAGDSIKVTLPISADENIASLVLVIQVKDAKGNDVLYGDETPSNSFIYTADVPHNTFAIVGVTPDAAEAQASLTELAVLLESPLQFDGVGGFDATKVVTLKNAADEDVATCTLDFDPEQFISNKAIVKLSAPVTEAGQYTLTVPEGAIYNLVYDDEKEDLGVSDGAIYNPAYTVTFTVDPTVGIVNVEVSNAAGQRIYNLQGVKMQKAQRGVNIVNGKKVLVK